MAAIRALANVRVYYSQFSLVKQMQTYLPSFCGKRQGDERSIYSLEVAAILVEGVVDQEAKAERFNVMHVIGVAPRNGVG